MEPIREKFSKDAISIYNELLHYGHIQPTLTEYERYFFDTAPNPLETTTDTELLSLAYQSKTASRREYSYNAYTPAENWKSGDTVELARFTVPSGNIGVLRRIDTVVIDSTTGRNISQWNNPNSWDNVFRFVITAVNASDRNLGQRLISIPAGSQPANNWPLWISGIPLFPINTWTDDRYSWGNPSNEMLLFIPKQTTVRLFGICIEDTGFKHTIRGRLVATQQLERSLSAAWKTRREV